MIFRGKSNETRQQSPPHSENRVSNFLFARGARVCRSVEVLPRYRYWLEMASSGNGKRTVRICWDLSWFVQHKLCPQCRNSQSPDYYCGSNATNEARSDRTDSTRPIKGVFFTVSAWDQWRPSGRLRRRDGKLYRVSSRCPGWAETLFIVWNYQN